MHTGQKVSTFRDRFSELLFESGVGDIDIARGLKVSKQTISAWKNGKRSPKEPTLITIAQFFHVSIQWLMGFDVEKSEDTKSSQASANDSFIRIKYPETRTLAGGFEKMPDEARDKLMAFVRDFFTEYFPESDEKGQSDDEDNA